MQKREIGHVRAKTLVKQILGLKGVVVSEVSVSEPEIVVMLKLTCYLYEPRISFG